YLDPMPLAQVKPFEEALLTALRGPNAAILDDIRSTKDLSKDTETKLKGVVESVAKQFG
ncbi:MAG: F0F1 ATP synthase subunit alpha, partial [Hyphomicrobium sp.]|nr:F0F1 ATP synthase subunit alpha [Hyphomicrobium sp.]